jgi:DNA-binding transcriptional MerR regulator
VATYRISELARRTGTTPGTLRFYEREGLLPADRSPSGYRLYGADAAGRLEFISAAKRLGLPLAEIRDLLATWDEGECADLRDRLRPLLESKIAAAERHAAELARFSARLADALARLDGPAGAGHCEPDCCVPATDAPVPAAVTALVAPVRPRPEVEDCALPVADQGSRLDEWRDLLSRASTREPIDGGVRARLPLAAAARAAALAAAEAQCCPFLTFTLHVSEGEALLDILAPPDRRSQLSAMLAG